MGPDLAAVIASALFGTAAVIGATGVVFLGARFLRLQGKAQADLRRAIEEIENEMGEIHERLDTQERLLQRDVDHRRLEERS